ncbi:hypothetical protein SM611_31690 [Actinomadura sp. DLS-62]|uniref:Uncharacterized protein n=1 Tax=Actinomadura monticuli TaxID=3097367 RepID=A0ABV4QJZ5_9ACTN
MTILLRRLFDMNRITGRNVRTKFGEHFRDTGEVLVGVDHLAPNWVTTGQQDTNLVRASGMGVSVRGQFTDRQFRVRDPGLAHAGGLQCLTKDGPGTPSSPSGWKNIRDQTVV